LNSLILTIHVIACISLIILVLLQSGHEGMGVIFGGSSSTFFGSSGAGGLLSKLTVTMAVIFFTTSLAFTYIDSMKKSAPQPSVVLEQPAGKTEQAPSQPAAPGQQPGNKQSGQADGSSGQTQ